MTSKRDGTPSPKNKHGQYSIPRNYTPEAERVLKSSLDYLSTRVEAHNTILENVIDNLAVISEAFSKDDIVLPHVYIAKQIREPTVYRGWPFTNQRRIFEQEQEQFRTLLKTQEYLGRLWFTSSPQKPMVVAELDKSWVTTGGIQYDPRYKDNRTSYRVTKIMGLTLSRTLYDIEVLDEGTIVANEETGVVLSHLEVGQHTDTESIERRIKRANQNIANVTDAKSVLDTFDSPEAYR